MLLLRPHLVCLLVELLDFDFFGADVPFELFYLVVEHKLELFKLLDLLVQLLDLDLLLLNRVDSCSVLLLTSMDV